MGYFKGSMHPNSDWAQEGVQLLKQYNIDFLILILNTELEVLNNGFLFNAIFIAFLFQNIMFTSHITKIREKRSTSDSKHVQQQSEYR